VGDNGHLLAPSEGRSALTIYAGEGREPERKVQSGVNSKNRIWLKKGNLPGYLGREGFRTGAFRSGNGQRQKRKEGTDGAIVKRTANAQRLTPKGGGRVTLVSSLGGEKGEGKKLRRRSDEMNFLKYPANPAAKICRKKRPPDR